MKRLKSSILAALVVVMGVVAVLPTLPAAAQSSASLSIVPKKNYTIEPGKSIQDTLTIRNLDSEHELELYLRVIDFSYSDDTGTPRLLLDENASQTTWSLKPYLTVPEFVTVEPSGSTTLDMGIDIPENLGAGSYYSAILYSSGAPEGGNVGLSASGVTLAFVSVPGEVNEDLSLKNFGAYHSGENGTTEGYTWFTLDEPQMMAYTLENKGNVTESPAGSITIKNLFGPEYTITNVNPNDSLALIGQTRTFTACTKLAETEVEFGGSNAATLVCDSPGLWPGIYTAKLELYYGQNGNQTQEIIGTGSFIYMPPWFIVTVLIVLVLIGYFVWRIVYKVKNRSHAPRGKKLRRR